METWQAIIARRNVRSFTDQPIEEADLNRILEAARRTPSSKNQQRWDFIVCTDRTQLGELAKVWRGAGHVAESAATIALIAPDALEPGLRESIQYDLGQVTMSIMLAATDLGIGSGHAGAHDQEIARAVLGLPADHFCAWLIALGYPADRPLRPVNNPARRPIESVVHRDRWSG